MGEGRRPPRPGDLPPPDGTVHLVGVGGAGMRGLARLFAGAGYPVSGCDIRPPDEAAELEAAGLRPLEGHDPGHVEGVRLVVHTSAVPADHPELEAARRKGIPVWTRARALGALVNGQRLAAVAGTHGKSTITAMATLAAEAGGLSPTGVVGGRVPAWGQNVRVGDGRVAVVEADEYDRSFLELDPDLALVSAVEAEHLDTFGTAEAMEEAYGRFASRAAERTGVLYCADEPAARRLLADLPGASRYGLGDGAEFRGIELDNEPGSDAVREDSAGVFAPRRALLEWPDGRLEFELAAPGRHNLQNAVGALAVAILMGGRARDMADALRTFRGVERRLEILVDHGGLAVVDDYAHHPTEVRTTLRALRRLYPERRVVAVFQPHLYSRTRDFGNEFAEALGEADRARVLPIYPAREEPIPGVEAGTVVEAAGPEVAEADEEAALEETREAARGASAGRPAVVVFMGAGDVTELARRAAEEVQGRTVGT